jgi:hypothetical protein
LGRSWPFQTLSEEAFLRSSRSASIIPSDWHRRRTPARNHHCTPCCTYAIS